MKYVLLVICVLLLVAIIIKIHMSQFTGTAKNSNTVFLKSKTYDKNISVNKWRYLNNLKKIKITLRNFLIIVILGFLIYNKNTIFSFFKQIDNTNKRIEKREQIKKEIEVAEKEFDEFFKEGEYIPIEDFRSEILKQVNNSLNIVFVNTEGDDSEPLMIKPRPAQDEKGKAQMEIDRYIKNARDNYNAKYAYVNINEESFLHTVTLTENNFQ